MVVGYKGKDRIFHLPFAVAWIELELEIQGIHKRFFIASSICEFSKLSR